MADRVAVMADGRILQIGAPAEVYNRPRTRFVAEFLGTANIFHATRDGDGMAVRVGATPLRSALPAPAGRGRFLVAVRPENLHFGPPGSGGVTVRVAGHAFRGSSHAFELAADGMDRRIVAYRSADAASATALAEGDLVDISWPAAAVVTLEDDA